jgi:hypothetical protein
VQEAGTKKLMDVVVRNKSGQLDDFGEPPLDKLENGFIQQVRRTAVSVFTT